MSPLETIQTEALARIASAEDIASLEQVRVDALGKKGTVTELMKQLGGMDLEAKKAFGAQVNQIKELLQVAISERKGLLEQQHLARTLASQAIDISLPGRGSSIGNLHPITRVLERMEAIFASMGFEMAKGPEIEDDYHNFEALNFPPHHPAPPISKDTRWRD